MAPKIDNGIYWTNLELKGLLEDEDSCVCLEKAKKHLGLLPFHLNDLNGSLRDILNATLNFYDQELKGFVLAYRNPKLFSPCGEILYDTPFIHVDIEADFYIFRPKVGQSLRGFVNKKGMNHIGILVHKAFNVSVPKPEYLGEEEEEYVEWPGDKVKVGQEIRFTPEKIDHKSRLPYIRGSLKEEEYLQGCKLFDEKIAALQESEFQEITRWNFKNKSPNGKNKISLKTENKKVVFDSDGEEANTEEQQESSSKKQKLNLTDPDTGESTNKSPTKKRKKHREEAETEDERTKKSLISKLPEQTDDIESVTNSQVKKHKKKSDKKLEYETEDEKRHKSTIEHLAHESSLEEETPTKSTKRKKQDAVCIDTEDELNHKKTINKFITPDAPVEEVPKKKKRKRSFLGNEMINDTEDERAYKTLLKDTVVEKPTKKRKSSFVEDHVPVDTEDEKNYKSSLKEWMNGENTETESEESSKKRKKKRKHSENNSEFLIPEAPPKKKKKSVMKEDSMMDTEDEKQYKSYLKTLVESMEDSDKVVKVKKNKSLENGKDEVKDETKQELKRKLKKEKKIKEFTE